MAASSIQLDATEEASDDMDLVHACKNGDVSAFEQLVKRYDRKLFRIAQSVTHNREDSQDAVQEAFLKAYQHLENFREACLFSTWLIRITVNQALMKLRKQRGAKEISLDEDLRDGERDFLPTEVTDWSPNPEQLCWAGELRGILERALDNLQPVSRMVFVLRDMEGLSIDQTAVILNMSHSAIKARLWRVRLQLREALSHRFSAREESAFIAPMFYKTMTEAVVEAHNVSK